jgi:hypothetical protein
LLANEGQRPGSGLNGKRAHSAARSACKIGNFIDRVQAVSLDVNRQIGWINYIPGHTYLPQFTACHVKPTSIDSLAAAARISSYIDESAASFQVQIPFVHGMRCFTWSVMTHGKAPICIALASRKATAVSHRFATRLFDGRPQKLA